MELVLQGYKRQVYKHTIKAGHVGHPYGTVTKDAVSVFPVRKHELTLGGAFDGHISVSLGDLTKILTDAAERAPIPDLLAAIVASLRGISDRSYGETDLLDRREESLLDNAIGIVTRLAELTDQRRIREADEAQDESVA